MENTNTGMSTGVKALIFTVIIAVVSVGGYFGYTKLIKKPDGTPNPNPNGNAGDTKNSADSKPTDSKPTDTDSVKGSGSGGGKSTEREPVVTKPSGGGGSFGGNASSLGITRSTVIGKASKGEAAKYAQRALNQLGASLEADGIFGTKSQAALLKITGKKTITLGELADFAKGKGKDNVFGIQLY